MTRLSYLGSFVAPALVALLGAGCACEPETHSPSDASSVADASAADASVAPDAAADADAVRSCGGLAETLCDPGEFCDFPRGSYCGGDDSQGVCRPRPDDCPLPGGVPVCGCDHREYMNECLANAAGTAVADFGPCVTAHLRTAMAEPTCAPWDGPAWRFTLTRERTRCDEEPTDGLLLVDLWVGAPTLEMVYALGDDGGGGGASVCARPGVDCSPMRGTIVFHRFNSGEEARFDLDLQTEDGRRFAETDVAVDAFWCGEPPRCG